MKAAISAAVATYAAASRHPRCITPPASAPVAASLVDQQATRILELDGKVHAFANRLTAAEGALDLIAMELGLPAGSSPPAIAAAVQRISRRTS